MTLLTRWLAPAALGAALAAGALAPAPAQARDPLVRVIVDLGDVVFRAGHPYYRYGRYGDDDRLIVDRDRYGRPVYYRYVTDDAYRAGPPYGRAYGDREHRRHDDRYAWGREAWGREAWGRGAWGRERCDRRGRCRVEYYDPRHDRDDWRDDDRRRWHDDD